jgi:hypothetical protein
MYCPLWREDGFPTTIYTEKRREERKRKKWGR